MSRLFMYIGNSSNYTALVIITDHSMIIPNSQFLAASCVPLKWQDHEAADTANTQKVGWYGTAIKSNDSHNVFYDDIRTNDQERQRDVLLRRGNVMRVLWVNKGNNRHGRIPPAPTLVFPVILDNNQIVHFTNAFVFADRFVNYTGSPRTIRRWIDKSH